MGIYVHIYAENAFKCIFMHVWYYKCIKMHIIEVYTWDKYGREPPQ